ncbi:MAG: hypothetical protein SGPRY_009700 [Prymnesium sp.]
MTKMGSRYLVGLQETGELSQKEPWKWVPLSKEMNDVGGGWGAGARGGVGGGGGGGGGMGIVGGGGAAPQLGEAKAGCFVGLSTQPGLASRREEMMLGLGDLPGLKEDSADSGFGFESEVIENSHLEGIDLATLEDLAAEQMVQEFLDSRTESREISSEDLLQNIVEPTDDVPANFTTLLSGKQDGYHMDPPGGTHMPPYPGEGGQQPPLGHEQQPLPGKGIPRNMLLRKEWTAEEDSFIKKAVAHNKGWRYIATRLPGRSDDAVRNRWKRLRDPSEKERVTWSPAEDQVILDCVKQFGHKWGVIAQRLPGRTEHAIRNRHQRLITISVAATAQ